MRGTGPLSPTASLALPFPALSPTSPISFWLIATTTGADAIQLVQEAVLLPSAATACQGLAVAGGGAEETLDLQGPAAPRVGGLQEEGGPRPAGVLLWVSNEVSAQLGLHGAQLRQPACLQIESGRGWGG